MAPGSAVALVVSSGPAPVAVPNVVGLSQAAAETAITGAGLTVGTVTNQNSDTVPSGDVISQSPAAGASVAPGSAVALVVSSGAGPGGGTGKIRGTVKDSSGSKVEGALVKVETPEPSTTTNKGGKYNLGGVPAGSHTLTASKNGCAQDIPVIVVDGNTLRVDVALSCLP